MSTNNEGSDDAESLLAQAELDAAEAEGGRKTMIHLESGGRLEVFPGQEVATDQTTGMRYSVSWAQDESGAISVRPVLLSLCFCGDRLPGKTTSARSCLNALQGAQH